MKTLNLLFISIIFSFVIFKTGFSQVAINTSGNQPDNSAMLDVSSTSKGMLIPRMLESERTSIISPVQGLMVYQTNISEGFYYYDGTSWLYVGNEENDLWTRDAGNSFTILANSTDNVGIGTFSPNEQLEITENFRIPSTTANTGIIFKDGNTFIHNFGTGNTFVGESAGNLTLSSAYYNTAFGYQCLSGITTGTYNIAIGNQSMKNSTTSAYNVAIGNATMDNNTSASYDNVAIGRVSMRRGLSDNSYNIALGAGAMFGTDNYTNSRHNISLGFYTMQDINGADYNIIIGGFAGRYITTGSNNVIIGYEAGNTNITGGDNIFIGYNAGYSETGSNKLYIENSNSSTPLIGGDFSTDEVYLYGDVGIKTGNPDGILHLDNGVNNTDFILEKDAGTVSNIIFDEGGTQQAKITYDANENLIFEQDKRNQDIIFKVNDNGSDNEVLRIDGSETRVGINTSSPNLSLAVNGDATARNYITVIPLWQAGSAYSMSNTSGQDLSNCEAGFEPALFEASGNIEVKLVIRVTSGTETNTEFQLRAHNGSTQSWPIVNTDSWSWGATQSGNVVTSPWKSWSAGTNAQEIHLYGWVASGTTQFNSAYLLVRPAQP